LTLALILSFGRTAEARDIYVRLADGESSLAIASEGPLKLVDGAKKTHSAEKSIVLTRSGSSAVMGKTKMPLPLRISGRGLLRYKGRQYRGEFLLSRDFVLINTLDVEDYIRGVLPAEASSKWPAEYLKVQAIISRTYGVRQSLNRSMRGYDVGDTASDQVYKGAGVETAATDRAVRETKGEIVTYNNGVAFTPFHSDSGGHTASNANVWGEKLPYLTGVKEPVEYESPNSSWTAKIPASQMQAALSRLGISIGQLREVRVSETEGGGRAVRLTLAGSAGSAEVKASRFRMAVGPNLIKSTLLTGDAPLEKSPSPTSPAAAKKTASQTPPNLDLPMSGAEEARLTRMTVDGAFSSSELMDMLLNPEKRKSYLYLGIQRSGGKTDAEAPAEDVALPQSLPVSMPALRSGQVIAEENGFFTFRGRGWGHGVGLSQWGAQALARQGWKAERILEYYFSGTTVKKFK
jgi:stage II sporulation protein D